MTRLAFIAALSLTAAACAPTPEPESIVRTVTVEVPVAVPCVVKVEREDIDITPIIRAAADVLGRVEILLDYVDYLTAQRDAERAANSGCGG